MDRESHFTIGSGVLYTLQVNSSAGRWIGYQVLAGFGAGASVQIPFISVQVVLSKKDMPSGVAMVIFCNSLGGAVAVSIAQTIFVNTLRQQLGVQVTRLDPQLLIDTGATNFRTVVPPQLLSAVLELYDIAITKSYILPIAATALAFLCSLAVEWKSAKGKQVGLDASV